jgi:rhodanese-related sulfurtransferase
MMSIQTVEASTLTEITASGATLIDVRTPAEYQSAHVIGAELCPLDRLNAAAFSHSNDQASAVYILCQSGKRACIAAEKLSAIGFTQVLVIEGGTEAAIEAGIAIKYGKSALSIERQVRIAAGLLVLCGTLAGVYIHSAFLFIPGFVGAGLTFAGISDTCGMAMLLTKCPWNQ